MGMIIHKTFGAGEIIDRDDKNNITVRFGVLQFRNHLRRALLQRTVTLKKRSKE